jgi:GT2 family glycosyltransferase
MKDSVTIVIVTYNGMQWLPKTLASIPSESKIVVVDNNSTDNTVAFAKENFPQITVLENEENLGFGQANNIGISYALRRGAEYVFLMNQDAYLQEGCVAKLIEVLRNHTGLGVLSPVHLNGKGTRLDKNFSVYVGQPHNADFYSDHILNKELDSFYEVPFVNAAGWLLPKSTLNKVGGFDPLFFHYGEDDNYCQRLRYHNLKIGVVPNVYIYHDREDRAIEDPAPQSRLWKMQSERQLKLFYADVNTQFIDDIPKRIKKLRFRRKKAILRGKWTHARRLKEEQERFERLYPKLRASIETNKKVGPHYLNFI